LCDAAVKWDPRRGGFKQYASIRIYGSVMDEARRTPGFSRSGRAVALVELGDLTAVEDPGFEMVESVAEQMALWRFLSEAVHRLSARDRLILTLYVFEGVTLATIGEFLGYTESYMSILVKDSLLFCRSFVHHPIHRHRLVGVNS
jgi:RNA polymerase sigma factor (sigma-70 family)